MGPKKILFIIKHNTSHDEIIGYDFKKISQ